jgi:hypothetical protein
MLSNLFFMPLLFQEKLRWYVGIGDDFIINVHPAVNARSARQTAIIGHCLALIKEVRIRSRDLQARPAPITFALTFRFVSDVCFFAGVPGER